jgi:epoxide hydrolase 4
MELEHTYIETNGIRLHVVQAVPKSGIAVVLLHGFSEFWHGWTQSTKRISAYEEVCNFTIEKCSKWMI